jgi:Peptidyl-tRNA hydrolase PTH2
LTDPYRMYLVVRRGAVDSISRGGALAGAAAVGALRAFGAPAQWRERPGKVCLRARSEGQWATVLDSPHFCADEGVLALPPVRRSERPEVLDRLQAMSTELEAAPASGPPGYEGVTYVLNPDAVMSSGKTLAQVAHAAVMASAALPAWAAAGCPGRVVAPAAAVFAALRASDDCVASVVDAGLTEVPPGTVTVLALRPGASLGP